MKIAIPTDKPGGLEANRSDHFGHCDVFTVITFDDNLEIKEVDTVENGDHAAGGCLVPVQVLNKAGVEAIVVGGMGARPMQGFNEVGIDVYFANRESLANVEAVIKGYKENKLILMHADQVCKGSGNCQH